MEGGNGVGDDPGGVRAGLGGWLIFGLVVGYLGTLGLTANRGLLNCHIFAGEVRWLL